MKNRLTSFLSKHKRIFLNLTAVVCVIPCFCINAFAYNSTYPQHDISLKNIYGAFNVNGTYQSSKTHTFSQGDDDTYYRSGLSLSNAQGIRFAMCADTAETDRFFSFPVNNDLYDYYFAGSFYSTLSSSYALALSDVRFYSGYLYDDVIYEKVQYSLEDLSIVDFTGIHVNGSSFYGKFEPFEETSSISFIELDFNTVNFSSSNVYFHFCVIYVEKGTGVVSDIQSLIIEQNELIENGNSGTGDVVSEFQDKDSVLNEVVSEYQSVEQQFFDDFTANQEAISADIVGWSWGGLVSCANWVGETMTDYYNNMGDFRQYIIYPLMLGIALFFLGRGSSIIGHLYRKPTVSVVETQSVTKRIGKERYTRTTTHREGGVRRK